MLVKICGITSVGDALMVAREGADAIGLNFYPDTPRAINMAIAIEVVANLPPFVDPVGLFVHATSADVRRIAQPLGLRTIQLHGKISPELVADLHEFSVISSVALESETSVDGALDFVAKCETLGRSPSLLLVDGRVEGKYGGTGQVAPWKLAKSLIGQSRIPVVLAGGLTPKNVTEAVCTVRPWGVDVASGVEVAPGRKEAFKVRQFIQAVRKTDGSAQAR